MPWLLLILTLPYIYILGRFLAGLEKLKPYYPKTPGNIPVTIIIPCRNEESNICRLLEGIAKQDYPQESFEVIVADDNSTDNTFIAASEFKAIQNLKVVQNKGRGKKTAIKTAVPYASSGLIITTDADCSPGPGWLSAITAFWCQYKPSLVIGPVAISGSGGFLAGFQEMEFLVLQGVTAGSASAGSPLMCNGANLAFTKETYTGNSGNLRDHIASGDDVFLLHSVKKNKGSILWLESEKALVSTKAADKIQSLIRQRARWISKSGEYYDRSTRLTAIVTFVTILLHLFTLVAGIFSFEYLILFLLILLIKSVPEYLLLANRAGSYNKKGMLHYFIPAQVIYPFYVLAVLICWLGSGGKQKW